MGNFNISVKNLRNELNVNKVLKYLFTFLFVLFVSISNATNYYVSASGNDANPGTSESQPWKSVSKVSSFYFSPGDHILFKRGDSWSGTITVTSSGASGSPIVYGAYGTGEKPKIYGSEEITGWTKHSGNIYKATFGTPINQLFVGDLKMKIARHPNSGYLFVNSVQSSTTFTCNNLNGGINYTGATWFGRTAEYFTATVPVSSSSSNALTLVAVPAGNLGVNEGFVLMNKLQFLDEAGEWFYDNSSKTVYLWMPNGDSPANNSIKGSVSKNGFYASNKDYISIQNLDILQHSEKGIFVSNCDQLTIDNNDISNPDEYGIYDNSNSTSNTITNNTITGANHFGLYLRTSSSLISDNNVLETAVFDNIGISGTGDHAAGGGIFIGGINGGNTISYNRIIDTGYHGIYFARPNNLVQYNFVKDACLLKGDGGGIYTSFRTIPGPNGSKVRNNIVLNVPGNKYGFTSSRAFGEGIYIDESSEEVLVENNTVAYCSNSGIFLHDNAKSVVKSNTIIDGRYGILVNREHGANSINDNIIYALDQDDYEPNQLLVKRNSVNTVFNNNTYVNHYNSSKIFKEGSTYYDFQGWKSISKQDANSKLDVSRLGDGETEELFYNDTKQTKTISLGTVIYRDIDGANITGSLTLQPFTSKILIKTSSSNSGSNQKPVIENQSFGILGDQQVNDFIGQIVASEPDSDQKLTYAIEGGNTEGLFYIDGTTGAIYANTVISETSDKSIEMVVTVTDNAVSPLSASAFVTINITGQAANTTTDVTPPSITTFILPSTYESLTVPVTSLSAEDNVTVTGYLLSTSSQVPSVDNSGWTETVPSSFVFEQVGTYTVHAWAKDANNNISSSTSASVTISIVEVDLSSTYSEYLFEEGVGAVVIDSRGSNDGVILNEENRITGVKGKGVEFTGSGYINLGQCFGDNVINEVTVSSWIKPSSTAGDFQGVVMHGGPVDDSFALYIKPGTNTVAFKTSATSSSWITVDNVDGLWDGNWHHVVATYNGNEKIIYFDKQELVRVSASGAIESGKGYNLLIGAGRDRETPILLYNGSIDEVRIYNYGLTSSEVAELYDLASSNPETVYTSEDISICEGSSYQSWTSAGEYQRVLQAVSGGDSIVTTILHVNPNYTITENIQIQASDNYLGWTTSGSYTRTLETLSGCDSIVTTILEVQQTPASDTVYTSEDISICEGSSYQGWTSAGEYQRVLQTSTGGDSIVTTYLQVNRGYNITENVHIQIGENYLGWTTSGHYTRTLENATGCDSIVTTILEVLQTSASGHFQTVWENENGQNHMNFCITSALIEGVQLEKGDEIAIFDNDICVGKVQLTSSINPSVDSTYAFISASQNDGNSNGFTIGDEISYRVWDASEQLEKNINQVNYNSDISEWVTSGKFVGGGTSVVELGYIFIEPVITQAVQLERGWNIFSAAVVPEEADMTLVNDRLINDNLLVKLQDESGNTLERFQKEWINNVGSLMKTEGYRIRVKSATNLYITGKQVSLPMNINVKTGSNLVSFPYNGTVDAKQVIQPLIDAGILEKVQDEKGNSIEYWGATIGWINGIGNFEAGEGYLVQVRSDGILPINNQYEKSATTGSADLETVYFIPNFEGNGKDHMNINLIGLKDAGLQVGDEIAAFDGEICVGATKLSTEDLNKNSASIIASASDADQVNGFTENNDIKLKYWHVDSNSKSELSLSILDGNLIYNKYGSMFAMLNKQMPGIDDNGLNSLEIDMYPNPAINNVTISFSDLPEIRSKIILMDMNGKQLQSREVQSTHEVFDLQSYPTGVYLVKTIVGDAIKVNKLIKN